MIGLAHIGHLIRETEVKKSKNLPLHLRMFPRLFGPYYIFPTICKQRASAQGTPSVFHIVSS